MRRRRGWGVGRGCPPCVPPPQKFFSNVDIKWCNLVHSGGVFRLFSNSHNHKMMLQFCRARRAEDISSDDLTTLQKITRAPVFLRQILPNSAAQFLKLRKISRHCYPQIPYIPRPVLTDYTSMYKEFILPLTRKHIILGH